MSNKRYILGEKFSGPPIDTWGRFADTAEREHDIVPGDRTIAERSCVRVKVHNGSGEDIPAGGVILLGEARIEPNTQESAQFTMPVISGGLPDAAEPFGITTGPIQKEAFDEGEPPQVIADSGGVGRVAIIGYCWARVDITNESHDSAAAETNTTDHLISSTEGVPIRWKPSGTGVKLCLVELGVSSVLRVRTVKVTESGGIAADATGTCRIWNESGDTGVDMEATLAWAHGGSSISEGKEAIAFPAEGWAEWIFIGAECE